MRPALIANQWTRHQAKQDAAATEPGVVAVAAVASAKWQVASAAAALIY